MTNLKIKAFGITRDILGEKEMMIEINGSGTVAELRKELEHRFPELKSLKSLFIAVNNAYADEDSIVTRNDEIALIPPVSGG